MIIDFVNKRSATKPLTLPTYRENTEYHSFLSKAYKLQATNTVIVLFKYWQALCF